MKKDQGLIFLNLEIDFMFVWYL